MRYLLLALLVFTTSQVFSQGLTFNRVVTFSSDVTPSTTVTVGTVPVGKVWKVESVVLESSSLDFYVIAASNPGLRVFSGDGSAYLVGITASTSSRSLHNPIWLAAGDKMEVTNVSGGANYNYFFSIIEFNAP